MQQSQDPIATESQGASIDFLGIAWRKRWLLVFGLIAGAIGGYFNFLRLPPAYQSAARLLVERRAPQISVRQTEEAPQANEFFTHMEVLRSPTFQKDIFEKNNLGRLPTFAKSPSPLATLANGFAVERVLARGEPMVATSGILEIRFKGPIAEDCGIIVDALIAGYQSFVSRTYRNTSEEDLKSLKGMQDQLTKDLAEKERRYREISNSSKWLPGQNPHEDRIKQLDSQLAENLVRETELKSRIESLEKGIKDKLPRETLLMMAGKFAKDDAASSPVSISGPASGRREMELQLLPLALEEQALLEKYGEDYPKLVEIRRKQQLIRDKFGELNRDREEPKSAPKSNVDPVNSFLVTLQKELEALRNSEKELRSIYKEEMKLAKEIKTRQVEEESLRNELERGRKLYDTVSNRVDTAGIVKDRDHGFNISPILAAGTGNQVEPKLYLEVLKFGVGGAFLMTLIAFLIEIADKSFRSPDEIASILKAPVFGHIPLLTRGEIDPNFAGNESMVTVHQPRSKASEAYRAVRTALLFPREGQSGNLFQVTSPVPGDGKTTLIANLAVTIARSGRKVLLLDADLRRPRVHRQFGIDNPGKGLCQLIRGEAELEEVSIPSGVDGLTLIPCGQRPGDPAELLSSSRFAELLANVKEKYNIVLVDTPPLMAVSDPCTVAPRTDGLILVVRLTPNVRRDIGRIRDMLTRVQAKVLGVVVNGMAMAPRLGIVEGIQDNYREQASGTYGYGYGYGYSYSDSYTDYHEYEYADAYSDDDNQPAKPRRGR
jgi:capsular exopolysaccharide synthesis family protein